MDINDIILSKLDEIEKAENVKILYAVESGSRAWGFESPDSDYDVRFIYVHEPNWYLKLEKTSDVINWELNDVYDINGWDMQKMLRLLHKSNPTLFEWLYSPIIYRTTPFMDSLIPKADEFFSCRSGLYHYLSMAKTDYKAHFSKSGSIKLKKYFYVLRALLACRWIIENQTCPPVLFDNLLNSVVIEDEIRSEIQRLMNAKKNSAESEPSDRVPVLDSFIASEISRTEEKINELGKEENADWQKLNELFLSCLEYYDSEMRK